ncbi:MAG: SAP domain-containing protein [Sulfuricellaceae bacterium]
MKLQDVRTIARQLGINPNRQSKTDLIRTIQQREGNFDCYGKAAGGECDQPACLWRDDCFASSRE